MIDNQRVVPDPFAWRTSPGTQALGRNEVHVWLTEHDPGQALNAQYVASLSGEEHARAAGFRFEEHRVRFVARRYFLRAVLGKYLEIEPHRIGIETNFYGKPQVCGRTPLSFNLSHSGNVSLLALAEDKELGIDIERIDRTVNVDEVSRRFFSRMEVAQILGLPPELRKPAFFVCWARKEAFVKAVGRGLSLPLDRFSVSCGPGEPAALLEGGDEENELPRWVLLDLPSVPGFATALAGEVPIEHVTCRRWECAGEYREL